MNIVDQELQKMRGILSAPDPMAGRWRGMNSQERKTLIRHAGLSVNPSVSWEGLRADQRQKLVDSIKRAAAWARGLS